MDFIEWLESLRNQGMKLGLDNTREILRRLDNPQNDFPSIHVAGSNGKGTICSILSNTFTLNGIKTGFFSSPHLCNIEERMRINGVQISKSEFLVNVEKLYSVCEIYPKIIPTFYEATFLIAMIYFSSSKIERAIIETGLGGRLDSTILVNADCCILTQISLEHTKILGNTLSEIAFEKSAIAREGMPLISVWNDDENVRKIISESVSSPKLMEWYKPLAKQKMKDEAVALANLAITKMGLDFKCDDSAKLTIWPGRMQRISHSKELEILLDCAHNPSGVSRAFEEISSNYSNIKNIILGCTEQTNIEGFLEPVIEYINSNQIENLILTEPQGGRTESVSVKNLFEIFSSKLIVTKIHLESSPIDAIKKGKSLTNNATLLCIGSLYLIGNLLSILELDSGDSMSILLK